MPWLELGVFVGGCLLVWGLVKAVQAAARSKANAKVASASADAAIAVAERDSLAKDKTELKKRAARRDDRRRKRAE